MMRLTSTDGGDPEVFPASDFRSYLTYEETDYSYCGKTHYRGEVIRANSLARINMASTMGTPRADEYLSRFREAFGQPAHAILPFDLARGIDLVYGLERALDILGEPLEQGAARIDMELERAVGRVVRAFDPCISCATH